MSCLLSFFAFCITFFYFFSLAIPIPIVVIVGNPSSRYDELRKGGGLEKYMKKKSKKMDAKERKKLKM